MSVIKNDKLKPATITTKINNTNINDYTFSYLYDELGRVETRNTGGGIYVSKNIEYNPNNKLPSRVSYMEYMFENDYNKKDFIKSFRDYTNSGMEEITYTYDNNEMLVNEDNHTFANLTYVYDKGQLKEVVKDNNIFKVFEYINDRLTKITNNGTIKSLSYDDYGNVASIGNDIITYNDRNLMETYKKDNVTTTYKYNYQGVRYQKVVGNTTIDYYLDGNKIVGETRTTRNDSNEITDTKELRYIYNEDGIYVMYLWVI